MDLRMMFNSFIKNNVFACFAKFEPNKYTFKIYILYLYIFQI